MVVEAKSERCFGFSNVLFMAALTCKEVYDIFAVATDGVSDFICIVVYCALKL